MKLFYISILNIFLLLLIGCSHTYEVSKYYSKDNLYNEFNESAQKNELKIMLTNDSVFITSKGAYILNDSMVLNPTIEKVGKSLSLININKASYKDHWKGVLPGFLIGMITGGALGATGWIYKPKDESGNPPYVFDKSAATIRGALLGAVVGSIIGYFLGYDYTYLFNPSDL